jgi:hypothetical protein
LNSLQVENYVLLHWECCKSKIKLQMNLRLKFLKAEMQIAMFLNYDDVRVLLICLLLVNIVICHGVQLSGFHIFLYVWSRVPGVKSLMKFLRIVHVFKILEVLIYFENFEKGVEPYNLSSAYRGLQFMNKIYYFLLFKS